MKSIKKYFVLLLGIVPILFAGLSNIDRNYSSVGEEVVKETLVEVNNPAPLRIVDPADYRKTTFNELGTPTIANGDPYNLSSFEDGDIYYRSTGSTVGFYVEDMNVIFDFYLTINKPFAWPSWFSMNLRASDFGRTHQPMTSIGYVILFYPGGAISVGKEGTNVANFNYPLVQGTRYDFQIGTVNHEDGVVFLLYINGTLVGEYFDETDPLTAGHWFTFCGDTANGNQVDITYKSKWDVPVPQYETYTFSTLGTYAIRAGGGGNIPDADKYNNIRIFEAGQTVGFYRYMQNFSLGGNYHVDYVDELHNLFWTLRASNFSRYNGVQTGYNVRIRNDGAVWIYKTSEYVLYELGFTWGPAYEAGEDYYIEVGTVDYSPTKTKIFIIVNNVPVLEVFDTNAPHQYPGMFIINPEGNFLVTIGSQINCLIPLQTRCIETSDSYKFVTYLSTPFGTKDLSYESISDRVLESIYLNSYNVKEINDLYYALDSNDNHIRAVDAYSTLNQFIVEVKKETYLSSTDALSPIDYEGITVNRARNRTGFVNELGNGLKNSYTIPLA